MVAVGMHRMIERCHHTHNPCVSCCAVACGAASWFTQRMAPHAHIGQTLLSPPSFSNAPLVSDIPGGAPGHAQATTPVEIRRWDGPIAGEGIMVESRSRKYIVGSSQGVYLFL